MKIVKLFIFFILFFKITALFTLETGQELTVFQISEKLHALYDEKAPLEPDVALYQEIETKIEKLQAQLTAVHIKSMQEYRSRDISELAFYKQENLRLQKKVIHLGLLAAGTGLVAGLLVLKEFMVRKINVMLSFF